MMIQALVTRQTAHTPAFIGCRRRDGPRAFHPAFRVDLGPFRSRPCAVWRPRSRLALRAPFCAVLRRELGIELDFATHPLLMGRVP